MRVTHTDLMKLHFMSKQTADRSDQWYRDNHVGKYKRMVPTDIHSYYRTNSNYSIFGDKVEHENNKAKHKEGEEDNPLTLQQPLIIPSDLILQLKPNLEVLTHV